MKTVTLKLASALLLAMASLATSAAEPSTPPPIADFFKLQALGSPKLSPNGKQLAMLAPSTLKDGRITLAVADATTPSKMTVVAHLRDADVREFHWVNDERLVFSVVDFQAALGDQFGGGLYGINADGSDFKWLIARKVGDTDEPNVGRRPLTLRHMFAGLVGDGSDDVLVVRWERTGRDHLHNVPMRLNTKTRGLRAYDLGKSPADAQGWIFDASKQPQPRVTMASEEETSTIYWRDSVSSPWRELVSFNSFTGGVGYMEPVAVDADGKLYVSAVQDNPQRTSALYRFDTTKKKLDGEPLVVLDGFDFNGQPMFDQDTRRMLGVTYTTDAPGVAWFDPGMKEVQARIDKQLSGTVNRIVCSRCEKADQLVVWAESDRQSPVYFLYDRATDKLSLIGASRPWINAKDAAEVDFERVKARDGESVPVYVTRPKGKGPWPTVVMVHGGPYVRGGEWGWDRDAQFLASRGYAVVAPEFRGSTGFGQKHYRSGWKQWGLAMQDDITDATKWAIDKGIADPKRIAIAGASYGGYATMMGLVKEPDLYRAGINWVGVTDIGLMYDIGWSDFAGGDWQRYGMPALVGDSKKDAAQLVATSPLKQASRITKPVLLAYGGADLRVPLPHGTRMRDALKKAGKVEVEWVEYSDEGHGWLQLENNVDFWGRVERFLAKNLK